MTELTFIKFPFVFNISKIKVIYTDVSIRLFRNLIEDTSSSTELILHPITFVCSFSIRIKKFTITVHSIIFPLTLIRATVGIHDSSDSILFVILLKPFVSASCVLLYYKSSFLSYYLLIDLFFK
jgi:hypothetical protein